MKKQKVTKNWAAIAVVVMVAPLSVTVPESDSTYSTTITLAGGAGRHGRGLDVYLGTTSNSGYGCDGSTYSESNEVRRNVDLEEQFADAGAGIDRRVGDSKLHIGLRAGYVWEQASAPSPMLINSLTNEPIDISGAMNEYRNTSYWYVNPYMAIEARKVGFGFGIVRSAEPLRTEAPTRIPEDMNTGESVQPSFHLRFGPRDKFYVAYRLWEGIPIYSGGGKHNAGMGFTLGGHMDVWAAYALGGPYRTNALFLQTAVRPNSPVGFNLSLRVPTTLKSAELGGGINEIGGSFGLVFRR